MVHIKVGHSSEDQLYVSRLTEEKILRKKMESKSYTKMVEEAKATLADNNTWTNIKPE